MQSASRRPAQGVSRRAFDDDGVAGDERGGSRAAGKRERKIERRDHDPGAIRPHDAAIARHDVRQRVVRQLVLVVTVLLEVVGVVPEEVHRLLRLAERFHAVLADFERECRGDFVDARFHDVRDTAQQAHSLAGRCGAPGRKRLVRGVHGGASVLLGRHGELPELDVAVDRAAAGHVVRGGRVRAIQEQRVTPAEHGAHGGQRSIEALVHLRRRIEHRGVGEAEAHGLLDSMRFRRGRSAPAGDPAARVRRPGRVRR